MAESFSVQSLPRPGSALIIPGKDGSGPDHWQTLFEARWPGSRRVQQQDWQRPDLEPWATRVVETAAQCKRPLVAVAHSFGCLAAVRAIDRGAAIDAALLVAPADPDRFGIARCAIERRLRLPALLVGSDNDPWLSATRAAELAKHWGAAFINLGPAGHINVAAGFGHWPLAERLAARLLQESGARKCGLVRPGSTGSIGRTDTMAWS
ncbi:MAG TPA: alpha/beta hydrolase [Immundisolibacter sp.]|nr:alpha/beta hydrolase [Immundisolibacter sp.]